MAGVAKKIWKRKLKMRTVNINNKTYRVLGPDEVIQEGDMIDSVNVTNLYPCTGSIGKKVSYCDASQFTFLRPYQTVEDIEVVEGHLYITKGGNLVQTQNVSDRFFNITRETSPTKSKCGRTLVSFYPKLGWQYCVATKKSDFLSDEWTIVEKAPFSSLPNLPPEFEWAGEEFALPFRKPKDGEYFVRYNYLTGEFGDVVQSKNFAVPIGSDERRIIVRLKPNRITELTSDQSAPMKTDYADLSIGDIMQEGDEYFVFHKKEWMAIAPAWIGKSVQNKVCKLRRPIGVKPIPFTGAGKYKLANGQIVELDEFARCELKNNVVDKYGNEACWRWRSSGEIRGLGFDDHSHLYLVEKLDEAEAPADLIHNGVAYYYLGPDEVLKEGDIIKYGDGEWNSCSGCIGTHTNFTDFKYARPIGEFRPLKEGEIVQEGDEYLQDFKWVKYTHGIGLKIEQCDMKYNPRRPIVVENAVFSAKATKKENVMTELISKTKPVVSTVLGFAWRLAKHQTNYWVGEPVKETAKWIGRKVRYATLFTAIGMGGYAYHNPEGAKELIKSCLPKIEIKVEKPSIMS